MNVVQTISPGFSTADNAIDNVFARQKETAIRLRASTARERIAKLKRLQAAIEANKAAIYKALYADLRKSETETDLTEILVVVGEIRHAARHLKGWMKPKTVWPTLTTLGMTAKVKPEPKGVTLIISPWNFPFNLAFGPLVSAIAAGNTAIIKPSELTPATSAIVAEIVRQVFDPSEVAVFEGDAGVATALLELPFDHIFFTGSPAIGKVVMAAAAKNLTSVTLELGGKSPVIVDETANLAKAAKWIAWGKFSNNGQICISPDYLYVHEKVLPKFVETLKATISKMYGADAKTSADYTRIVNDRHFGRVKRLLDDATSKGATIVAGGNSAAEQKYIAPTLVTNVPEDSLLLQEEIFGPVLPILSFKDVTRPIGEINSKPKPLALYVFSKSGRNIQRIVSETSAGGTGVNSTVVQFLHNNLPFGGVNNSGLGSSHGHYGFKTFSHERAVLKDYASVTPLLFPPYTSFNKLMTKLTVKFFA